MKCTELHRKLCFLASAPFGVEEGTGIHFQINHVYMPLPHGGWGTQVRVNFQNKKIFQELKEMTKLSQKIQVFNPCLVSLVRGQFKTAY